MEVQFFEYYMNEFYSDMVMRNSNIHDATKEINEFLHELKKFADVKDVRQCMNNKMMLVSIWYEVRE